MTEHADINCLPLELVDSIIDNVHDEIQSQGEQNSSHNELNPLKACSLTCHKWLHRSRYHLFRTLSITNMRYHATARCMFEMTQLQEVPAIAAYVQNIRLKEIVVHVGNDTPDYPMTPACLQAFFEAIIMCSNVQTIDFEAVNWGALPSEVKTYLPSLFPFVSTIVLESIHFTSEEELIDFVNRFPSLSYVALNHMDWNVKRRTSFRMTSLTGLRSILAPNTPSKHPLLRSFTIKMTPGPQPAYGSLSKSFRTFGASLEKLTIVWRPSFANRPPVLPSGIEFASRLRFVTFSITHKPTSWDPSVPNFDQIPVILNKIIPKSVVHIVFDCTFSQEDAIELFDLPRLDVVLSSPLFCRLSDVTFIFRYWAPAQAALEKRLPGLHSRGILRYMDLQTDPMVTLLKKMKGM